ncbi:MAG: hypothetical protein E6G53_12830 [Actinobacteria bacterium]|nr:MAG: hypothetical protein E6G53_12830 [Actinomycetota bacterium]
MLEQWTAFAMSMDEDLGYDLSPPVTVGAAGALGQDLAWKVASGRRLIDALGDEEVRDEVDVRPDALSAVARDASVRAALTTPP